MQPLWESINFADKNGTDFALSYHRGVYHRGYDDPEDIYLQRWRAEENAWNHTCCYPSGRCDDTLYEAMQDIMILTPDSAGNYFERPYRAPYTYGNCPYGTVKRVRGQAANEDLKVKTKYFDPTMPETNVWQANSVPPFSPWGFQVYNVKLWKEDYFQAVTTDIVQLLFNRFDEDHNGVLSANDINTPTTSRLFDPLKELFVVLAYLGIEYTLQARARFDPNYDMRVQLDEFRAAFGRDPVSGVCLFGPFFFILLSNSYIDPFFLEDFLSLSLSLSLSLCVCVCVRVCVCVCACVGVGVFAFVGAVCAAGASARASDRSKKRRAAKQYSKVQVVATCYVLGVCGESGPLEVGRSDVLFLGV